MNEQHSSSPDLYIAAMLLAIGLVAMTSASVEVSANLHGDALYYFKHQSLLMAVGVLGALVLARIPLSVHRKLAPWYGVFSLALLTLALVPGLGHTVNNSTRWLDLGPVRFQPSELIKPALVLWMAAYVAQHGTLLETRVRGTLLPLGIVALTVLLLLLEPDFGTACVIAATALCMLFLCGGYLRALLGCAICAMVAMGGLAIAAPYRLMRIQSFLDPWADPFNSGYQLTQSLIAIGSGGNVGAWARRGGAEAFLPAGDAHRLRVCRGGRGTGPDRGRDHHRPVRDVPHGGISHRPPGAGEGAALRRCGRLRGRPVDQPAGFRQHRGEHGRVADQGADPAPDERRRQLAACNACRSWPAVACAL